MTRTKQLFFTNLSSKIFLFSFFAIQVLLVFLILLKGNPTCENNNKSSIARIEEISRIESKIFELKKFISKLSNEDSRKFANFIQDLKEEINFKDTEKSIIGNVKKKIEKIEFSETEKFDEINEKLSELLFFDEKLTQIHKNLAKLQSDNRNNDKEVNKIKNTKINDVQGELASNDYEYDKNVLVSYGYNGGKKEYFYPDAKRHDKNMKLLRKGKLVLIETRRGFNLGTCEYIYRRYVDIENALFRHFINDREISNGMEVYHSKFFHRTEENNYKSEVIYEYETHKRRVKIWERMLNWWSNTTEKYKIPYTITGGIMIAYCHDKRFLFWDDDLDVIIGSGQQLKHFNEAFEKGESFNNETLINFSQWGRVVDMDWRVATINGKELFVKRGLLGKNDKYGGKGVFSYSFYEKDVFNYYRDENGNLKYDGDKSNQRTTFFVDSATCLKKERLEDDDEKYKHRCHAYFHKNKVKEGHVLGVQEDQVYDDFADIDMCGFKLKAPKEVADPKTRNEACQFFLKDMIGEKGYKSAQFLPAGKIKYNRYYQKVIKDHVSYLKKVLDEEDFGYFLENFNRLNK